MESSNRTRNRAVSTINLPRTVHHRRAYTILLNSSALIYTLQFAYSHIRLSPSTWWPLLIYSSRSETRVRLPTRAFTRTVQYFVKSKHPHFPSAQQSPSMCVDAAQIITIMPATRGEQIIENEREDCLDEGARIIPSLCCCPSCRRRHNS